MAFYLAVAVWAGWVLGIDRFGSGTATPNVECRLRALNSNGAPRFGTYREAIRAIEIDGHAANPFKGALYDFTGSAKVTAGGESFEAPVSGKVFLDVPGNIDALLLDIADARFGTKPLSVMTLDETGRLENSKDRAFAFVSSSNTLASTKLSWPMAMTCRAHVRPPLPSAVHGSSTSQSAR